MDFDLRALRLFLEVIESGSFSGAARALRITQPTVSQQIGRLEVELGGRLFERVGHEIHITELGKKFKEYALGVVEGSECFLEALAHDRVRHVGRVRYVMPESCQWTPHFRKIMSQIREFPDLVFDIGIAPTHEVIRSVLEGRADFGFAVGECFQPELEFEYFGDEEYVIVASDEKMLNSVLNKKLQEVRWIAFPGWELFFETWARKNGFRKSVGTLGMAPAVTLGTLAGAIHAAQEGAGVAVFPKQCVTMGIKKGSLYESKTVFKNAGNPVHIVLRRAEKIPRRAELILNLLRQAKRTMDADRIV
jgi:DNA-binding transcriptional LysR family regulator